MILIRADANELIGTGHVMRCLSIAHSFKRKGEHVLFVVADHRGDALITSQGFDIFCLNSEWTDMESELVSFEELIDKHDPSLIFVDSYYVTAHYFEVLSKKSRVAYFDDMNKEKWGVDFLINYNIFSSSFDYSRYENTFTRLMLQPQFAPLREEFKNAPKHEIKKVTDILISAGGADPERITERIIDSIYASFPGIMFHFIVGALNPRLEHIKTKASRIDNVSLHLNEHHMAALMNKCDIAVSASGTTLYELCAMGIPTITYTLADNQVVATKEFDRLGYMINAGDCRENREFINGVVEKLKNLIRDSEKRAALSSKMQELVNGNGSDQIVTYIHNSLLHDAEYVLKDGDTIFSVGKDGKLVAKGRTELGRNIKVCFAQNGTHREVLSSQITDV